MNKLFKQSPCLGFGRSCKHMRSWKASDSQELSGVSIARPPSQGGRVAIDSRRIFFSMLPVALFSLPIEYLVKDPANVLKQDSRL